MLLEVVLYAFSHLICIHVCFSTAASFLFYVFVKMKPFWPKLKLMAALTNFWLFCHFSQLLATLVTFWQFLPMLAIFLAILSNFWEFLATFAFDVTISPCHQAILSSLNSL